MQNDFITETRRGVLEQQLLLEFVKVFDKPNFNKEENCSVLLLHDRVEQTENVPYKSEIMNRLQALQKNLMNLFQMEIGEIKKLPTMI